MNWLPPENSWAAKLFRSFITGLFAISLFIILIVSFCFVSVFIVDTDFGKNRWFRNVTLFACALLWFFSCLFVSRFRFSWQARWSCFLASIIFFSVEFFGDPPVFREAADAEWETLVFLFFWNFMHLLGFVGGAIGENLKKKEKEAT